ncbi:DUF4037 domain-containing protein [Cellulomonas xylanilytica]|uniref:DUF4037 domain-containing protein n=1 Tax=Cellulomonas xylanilytica TaxID=233583 RepID=A0A510V320_9CELL|nr:DUF4037 domain-containing protein [Cellulomonas xylanilytica]GEK21206.1 hypothetical protein CXY01_17260 [Cellulomonas xylanilytica]
MTAFVPGLELARTLYDAVRPVLAERGLAHTAALVGPGSDVLGLDDATSTDHDWGPRLQLLLSAADHDAQAAGLHEELRHRVPAQVGGWTTRVAPAASDGTRGLGDTAATGPVDHRVEILTLDALLHRLLGPVDPREPMTAADWLVIPQQRLLSLTAGAVFHDDLGLAAVRDRLRWYPHDVWLYQQAAAWSAIGQDEHLAPRAGMAGDDLGSRLVTARVCRTAVQLAFLQERQYAPYDKWLGTALARLGSTAPLRSALAATLAATDWQDRQRRLGDVLVELVRRHNALGLTAPLPERTIPFHGRPFEVVDGSAVAGRIAQAVTDPEVRDLVRRPLVGGIDLLSASTDLAVDLGRTTELRRLY